MRGRGAAFTLLLNALTALVLAVMLPVLPALLCRVAFPGDARYLPVSPVALAQGDEQAGEAAEFYGVIGKRMPVYYSDSQNASQLGVAERGTVVDVYKKGRTWTSIDFGGEKGYVLTKYIERVQRKDPFAGPMPGTSKHVAVGYVLSDTSFKPEGYRYPIEVSAGSWLSIEEIKDGRAYFPYMRLEENMSVKADLLKLYDFVPWDEAQPGDLLYAFTTFYSTSLKKEGNAGRLHNIALATERLTSIRVGEGESFSFNAICGPYTEENGYRMAPILSGDSEMGYGGGVCQVCSTIYNIVLRVPAVIEAMNWHAQAGVSYLPAGFDATVGSKSDMVFRNVLPYDLRIEFESRDGVMTAFLFRDYDQAESASTSERAEPASSSKLQGGSDGFAHEAGGQSSPPLPNNKADQTGFANEAGGLRPHPVPNDWGEQTGFARKAKTIK